MRFSRWSRCLAFLAAAHFTMAIAQERPAPRTPVRPPAPIQTDTEFITNRPSNTPTSLGGQDYRIGRDDVIEVTVFEVPELGAVSRVSAAGLVSLPLIGNVEASGKTPIEVERLVEEALKAKYVNEPHVTVMIREYASQPVSVLGAVKLPGIYQIKGQKFLLDMLAMAQGLDMLTAGKTIQVIRRPQKEAGGPETSSADGSTAVAPASTITVDAEELFQQGNAELNIPILAGDVINVLQAGSVFVVGEVTRPNEYPMRSGKNVTVTQAVALGGGFTRDAKKQECQIIRYMRDGSKTEIPVNIAKIFQGVDKDVEMLPNDILFVPANRVKSGMMRALDSVVSVAIGRAIYAR